MMCSMKMIPQFNSTYYLALLGRVQSIIKSNQTKPVGGVEPIPLFWPLQDLAPGLLALHSPTLSKLALYSCTEPPLCEQNP